MDLLLEVGKNPQARKLVKTLGLPIPLPERLRRDEGPWTAMPLKDERVLVGAGGAPELLGAVAESLAAAGADPFVEGPAEWLRLFAGPGESYARPARAVGTLGEGVRVTALLFDASGLKNAAALRALYDFFHPNLSRLTRSGRAIVVARGLGDPAPEEALAQAAVEGFVRSLAKEAGRSGATVNLIRVERGAEGRLNGVLRFLASAKSAFITGQPIDVTAAAQGTPPALFVRPLERKVALVTGAARGIGQATARLLAQEGAHVVCLDRPADDGPTSQLAREIGGTALLVDIGAPDAPGQIADALQRSGGGDIVVHNAGITRDKTLARMSADVWDAVLEINLGAVARVTTELERRGKTGLKDGGRVICLSSVSGIAGNVGQTNYSASKAGIVGYVRALAPRLASRGITVNAIAPGFIETRLTAAIPLAIREVARRMSALGQGGQPEDVGQAIVFLASPGAQGITGSVLRVCGGSLVGA